MEFFVNVKNYTTSMRNQSNGIPAGLKNTKPSAAVQLLQKNY